MKKPSSKRPYRYFYSRLYDGVHGENTTKQDWADILQDTIQANRKPRGAQNNTQDTPAPENTQDTDTEEELDYWFSESDSHGGSSPAKPWLSGTRMH